MSNTEGKIRFVDFKSEVPIVEFSIDGGEKGYAVIDTGSEVTIFDIDFAKRNKNHLNVIREKEKISLVGIQPHDNLVIKVSAIINLNDEKAKHFHVLVKDAMLLSLKHISDNLKVQYNEDVKISAIFGSDLLNQISAKIDYTTKTITYSDDICSKQ